MANWQGVSEGINRGFQRGVAIGGRLSPLGETIKGIADRLRSQRETGEEMGRKIQLLGAEASLAGWKPRTKEEAIEFEKAKQGITDWDIQKEARTTVNAMINQNPVLQAQAFNNPELVTNLIDKEGERLKQKYKGNGITLTPTPTPTPEPKPIPTPTLAPAERRILVISPDGKKGTIPKNQLEDALRAGFKRTIK